MPYITRQDDISILPLSGRTQNCLRRADIHTVGAMLDSSVGELLNTRNTGKKSVEEIQTVAQMLLKGDGNYVLVNVRENDTEEPTISEKVNETQNKNIIEEAGTIVRDIFIADMQLSTRAKNILIRAGYKFASQLVGITYNELIDMQSMGKKTAEEILSYVAKAPTLYEQHVPVNENSEFEKELVAEMCATYGDTESAWMRELLTIKAKYPDAVAETLLYRLYSTDFVREKIKLIILRIIEANKNEISKVALRERLPQHLNNTTILEEILIELESVSAVEVGDVMVYRQYPSITQFIRQLKDNREKAIVEARLTGKTLQEIGEQQGLTRERIRQLSLKVLQKKPHLREDKYIYLYDHYDFSLEDFTLAYDEPRETFYYLEMISQITRAKRKPLEEILTDSAIAPELRKKAERAIYKQYISTDGVRVKMTRPNLVKHYIKTNCKTLTKFEDFVIQYNLWLDSLGLGDHSALVIEARTYENILNRCDYVLWNQWKRFRYYNIPGRDFEELFSTLDLDQFEGVEFSTLKLFRDYPELMQQYDIHDEYELHNLLKKIWPSENGSIKFKKMPTIEIGTADPNNQVLDLLLQYAPITADDLANYYEEEYGVKAMTVRGNYLRSLDHYCYQGVYSVDFAALPDIQFNRMQAVLDRDFYTIQTVKRLYKREFPHSDESLINPYTLKTLGFRVYSGYIVKNTHLSAAAYFRSLLTTDDIVDARNISKSIQSVVAYSSELYSLRAEYRIVEFSPLQYINIRRLNEVGITTDDFESYCKTVAHNYERGEYFTITSLRRDGFTHKMDDLGFNEWFYSSVLLEDRKHFSYQRIGGTRLFLRGKSGANLGDMLVWLLEKHQKIDFYDLIDLLEDRYGIVLPKEKLLTIIDNTELYYDTIMETVYIDYNTYFEEI